jgi:hypothetical protein
MAWDLIKTISKKSFSHSRPVFITPKPYSSLIRVFNKLNPIGVSDFLVLLSYRQKLSFRAKIFCFQNIIPMTRRLSSVNLVEFVREHSPTLEA